MKVIYIAGPFRAPTAWGIAENVRRAERAALEVAKLGAMPLCPHANTAHFQGECTDQFWLDGTMELLRRCDAVLTVEGWLASSWARAEVEEALRLGKPVFTETEPDQLADWIKEGYMPFIKIKNQGEVDWYEAAGGQCAITLRTNRPGSLQRLTFQLTPEDADELRALVAKKGSRDAQEG